MKLSTLIGSMPYKNVRPAVELIFKHLPISPCWPQLPKLSFKEHMCPQYSENFPGIVIDEQNEKIFVDLEKSNSDLEQFYQNFIDKNIDYFKISPDYAAGFYEFIAQLSILNSQLSTSKFQTTGPLTFGLTIKTPQGQAIFYNEQMRDVVIKHIVMKSIWQIHQLLTLNSQLSTILLFLDEPYLAAYGSAFTAVSREDIINCLNETIAEIKNYFNNSNSAPCVLQVDNGMKHRLLTLKIGIHCCANTDWSILTDLPQLDIISFDAYDFFNDFVLYSENIKNFIAREGILAWGIVPNNENITTENTENLLLRLRGNIETLVTKGVDKDKLLNNIIITPQCGLGNSTEQISEQVIKTCAELVKKI